MSDVSPVSRFSTFVELRDAVQAWAAQNSKYSYRFGSPASYFGDALAEGMINQLEYEQARAQYGNRWNYAGD